MAHGRPSTLRDVDPSHAPARTDRRPTPAAAPGHRDASPPLSGGGVRVTMLATVLASILLAVLWVQAATATGLGALDTTISATVVTTRPPWLAHLGVIVSNVGSPAVSIAAMVVAGLVVARRVHRVAPVLVAVGGVLALTAADVGIKDVAARPRPPLAGWAMTTSGYSFPSGHVVFSTGAVLLCALLLTWSRHQDGRPTTGGRRTLTVVIGGVVAIAVAVARVVVGVHYPTDVLAGWTVAVIAVGVTALLAQWALIGRRHPGDARRRTDDGTDDHADDHAAGPLP